MSVPGTGLPSRNTDARWRANGRLIELIEYVAVSTLKPYANHARRHSPDKIRRLRANINEFGFVAPLLVDANGVIIAGHARLAAAIDLGFETVGVIRVTHLNDAQVRALRIADNRLVELAQWDMTSLAFEFEAIFDADLDIELTGFSVPEIDQIFAELESEAEEVEDAGEVLPIGVPVSRHGDVWILGDHRVLCDSALDGNAFAQLMGRERAGMVFSDPPYNVPIQGHVSGNGRHQHREFAMASGKLSEAAFCDFLEGAIANAVGFSRVDAPIFVFMDWRHTAALHAVASRIGLKQINLCVWVKANAGMGSLYRSQHELILVFAREGAKVRNNVELGRHGRNRSNVWQYAGANSIHGEARDALADHPTPKPVKLVVDAVLDVTKQGDIVIDMFLGGGATLIACERARRRCRGIEIDPLYVDVAVRRWQRETGEAAHLEATAETFEQVMLRRDQPLLPDLREGS